MHQSGHAGGIKREYLVPVFAVHEASKAGHTMQACSRNRVLNAPFRPAGGVPLLEGGRDGGAPYSLASRSARGLPSRLLGGAELTAALCPAELRPCALQSHTN